MRHRTRIAPWLAALALAGCGGDGGGGDGGGGGGGSQREPGREPTPGAEVSTYVQGLEVPWDMAFLPDGSALVTEREGRVRLVDADGALREQPVAEIDVTQQGEGGLLGIALDPQFEQNGFVYLYLTRGDAMVLERHRYSDAALQREAILLDSIRAGSIHDSGRIRFGPDERLYVATGDAGDASLAQREGSLNGRFLRLEPDEYRGDGGTAEVVSLGHRNPQGFDWHPGSGDLIATEHGPSGNDEINRIEAGRNYGWPEVQGADHGDFAAPLNVYQDTIAPSGAAFVTRAGSAWSGDLLIAALRGQQLRRVRIDGDRVSVDEPLFEDEYGRLRAVVEGPDGAIYVTTSNRDGRGDPREGDDRILRIVPPEA